MAKAVPMNARRTAMVVIFVFLMWLFGGVGGLVAGLVIVALGAGLRLPMGFFWGLAVLLMAPAPLAILFGGLPKTPAPGPSFGTRHVAAHVLVGLSLASAAWAGSSELLGVPSGERISIRRIVQLLRRKESAGLDRQEEPTP
jgi:hypothetical protein